MCLSAFRAFVLSAARECLCRRWTETQQSTIEVGFMSGRLCFGGWENAMLVSRYRSHRYLFAHSCPAWTHPRWAGSPGLLCRPSPTICNPGSTFFPNAVLDVRERLRYRYPDSVLQSWTVAKERRTEPIGQPLSWNSNPEEPTRLRLASRIWGYPGAVRGGRSGQPI